MSYTPIFAIFASKIISMNDIVKTIDVKEMGMRFKLIRQKLGITQTNLAEQLGTSQVMIYRIEKGEKIMSSLFLKLVLFFAPHVSLDALFAKQFDIEDERVFSKDYSVNTLVKEKLDALREEINWVRNLIPPSDYFKYISFTKHI